jgi:hypothetical protein
MRSTCSRPGTSCSSTRAPRRHGEQSPGSALQRAGQPAGRERGIAVLGPGPARALHAENHG